VNRRHNDIVKCLQRHVKLAYGSCEVQPARLRTRDGVPDALVHLERASLVDVTIRTNASPNSAADPYAAENKARRDKEASYRAMAVACKAELCTFMLGALGNFGEQTIDLIKQVRDFVGADGASGLSSNDIFYSLSTEIAILLQVGNAKIIERLVRQAAIADLADLPRRVRE
jgi:hypothetical protein